MWIQVFVHSGVALGQAVSPHAGELSVGEQRGGFSGFAHAADPVQISLRMLREKDGCPDFDTY